MERIALHTFNIYNMPAMISTVNMYGTYETIVMLDDGDELELYRTKDLNEAKATHNRLVNKYNDRLYKGSIRGRLLQAIGEPNIGQMVTCVKAC
jgi:hypothetical protein